MPVLDSNSLADFEFELNWKSSDATHAERYLAAKVNMWRDIFTPDMEKALLGSLENDIVSFEFAPGEIVPAYDPKKVHDLPLTQFREVVREGRPVQPQFGRFYPCGLLSGVSGVYPQSVQPMRVIGLQEGRVKVDLNHPLAGYPVQVEVRICNLRPQKVERGGRCSAWLEEVAGNGPGMQARWQGARTDFHADYAFSRKDESNDAGFYEKPRLVGHVDSQASAFIKEEYGRYLKAGDKVLDLMSSVQSHLPQDKQLTVTGLGMNQEELENNPALDEFLIQDLNADVPLPFTAGEFQAVICSLSIEYLTDPYAVIDEAARVLAPGGALLVSFSNRWFPPKVTELWTHLHEFERAGLVLDCFLVSGKFRDL